MDENSIHKGDKESSSQGQVQQPASQSRSVHKRGEQDMTRESQSKVGANGRAA